VIRTKGITQAHEISAEGEERTYKAVAHVPAGEGTSSLWVFGELVIHKIPSRRTGGAYSLFEVTTQPGAGPPPHVNHREDESFYVLEGDYQFLSGGETIRAGAGSLLYVPKGTLHTHENVGDGAGRMLVSQTPGGLYERLFEELGKEADGDDAGPPVFEDRPGVRKILAVAARYGIEIPPPGSKES
jgi:mannose-6-phosphate isomerase-like protein (cupin superfamily)